MQYIWRKQNKECAKDFRRKNDIQVSKTDGRWCQECSPSVGYYRSESNGIGTDDTGDAKGDRPEKGANSIG